MYSTGKGSDPGPSQQKTTAGQRQSSDRPGVSRSHDSRQQSHDPRQQSTGLYGRSPLKRKRSPEPLQLSSAGGSRRSGIYLPPLIRLSCLGERERERERERETKRKKERDCHKREEQNRFLLVDIYCFMSIPYMHM